MPREGISLLTDIAKSWEERKHLPRITGTNYRSRVMDTVITFPSTSLGVICTEQCGDKGIKRIPPLPLPFLDSGDICGVYDTVDYQW